MPSYSVISPFVLTRELMPVLNQTAAEANPDVRVVVVCRVLSPRTFSI
jgi:hypothetical protein